MQRVRSHQQLHHHRSTSEPLDISELRRTSSALTLPESSRQASAPLQIRLEPLDDTPDDHHSPDDRHSGRAPLLRRASSGWRAGLGRYWASGRLWSRQLLLAAVAVLLTVLLLATLLRPVPPARLEPFTLPGTHQPGGWDDVSSAVVLPGRTASTTRALPLHVCVVGADSGAAAAGDGPRDDAQTAVLELARLVGRLGHHVTVLIPGTPTAAGALGALLPNVSVAHAPLHATHAATTVAAARSHAVLRWLVGAARGPRPCEVVHILGRLSDGWYTLLARQQGVALRGVAVGVHAHTPLLWRQRRDAMPLASAELAAELHMERGGLLAAPTVLVGSTALVEWLHAHSLLRAREVAVRSPPLAAAAATAAQCAAAVEGSEAGGLRARTRERFAAAEATRLVVCVDWGSASEVALVCNALTLLHRHPRGAPPSLQIELVARGGTQGPRPIGGFDGVRALREHARRHRWQLPYTVHAASTSWRDFFGVFGVFGASGGLSAADTVAAKAPRAAALLLLPLLAPSEPPDLIVAAACHVPLVAIATGGAAAQLAASSRAAALVAPDATVLAARLDELLRRSAAAWPRPRPAVGAAAAERWWREWHRAAQRDAMQQAAPTRAAPQHPAAIEKEEGSGEDPERAASVAMRPSSTGGGGGGDADDDGAALCAAPKAAPHAAQPSLSLTVAVVSCHPDAHSAHRRAALNRSLHALETAAGRAAPMLSTAPQLLLLRDATPRDCNRRRAGGDDGGGKASGETRAEYLSELRAYKAYAQRGWEAMWGGGSSRCGRGRGAEWVALQLARRATGTWTLLVRAGSVARPHTLCALLRAGGSAQRRTPEPAAFAPVTRLWAASAGGGARSALQLPLGGALSVGMARDAALSDGGGLLRTAVLRAQAPRPAAQAAWGGGVCERLPSQMLARVAAAGGIVEPLPLTLFDAAEPPPPPPGAMPIEPQLASVVLAGSRTVAPTRRGSMGNASGLWSPDALDVSAILLVLQGLSPAAVAPRTR